MTLWEISERLAAKHDITAPLSTVNDWLKAQGLSFKKTAHAAEQERQDVHRARSVWRRRQDWLAAHPDKMTNIVFVDETGCNTKMARLRGRCRRGERLKAALPHGHWKTMTFIAGLRSDKVIAPWVIDGAIDGDSFVTYVKTQLAPALKGGDVVVIDNLCAHKRDEAAEAIRAKGAWLLFLPPYSPDLNPQPHRTRFLQAQGASQEDRRQNHRRSVAGDRASL